MWNVSQLKYNPNEAANAITHGIGVILVLIGCPILLYEAWSVGSTPEFMALSVFCLASLSVYTFSTLYHAAPEGRVKDLLHKMDHISIYLMIAGTHTPFVIKFLNPELGINFLLSIWTLVAIGIIYKLFYFERYPKLSLSYYLILGWVAIFVLPYYSVSIPFEALVLVITGGIMYTIGVFFYAKKVFYYSHAIWHIFVLLGSISHYIALWYVFL